MRCEQCGYRGGATGLGADSAYEGPCHYPAGTCCDNDCDECRRCGWPACECECPFCAVCDGKSCSCEGKDLRAMTMHLEITAITIIRPQSGSDLLMLRTSLPSAVWPYEGYQSLQMHCAAESAEDYCAKHFPGVRVTLVKG